MSNVPAWFSEMFAERFSDDELLFVKGTAAFAEIDFDEFKTRCGRLGYPSVRRKPRVVSFPETLNAILIWRYPFLLCRNRFSDEACEFDASPFDHSELDALPNGWLAAFGLEICEDLRTLLLSSSNRNAIYEYRIEQIKEKFGTLRWYDGNVPQDVDEAVFALIEVYEGISSQVCIGCGSSNGIGCSGGWISHTCGECYADRVDAADFIEEVCGARIPWGVPWETRSELLDMAHSIARSESCRDSRKALRGRLKVTRFAGDSSDVIDLIEQISDLGLHATSMVDALDSRVADEHMPASPGRDALKRRFEEAVASASEPDASSD